MNYDAIIVASGSGSRLNLGYNKVFYRFEDGETILDKAMSLFLEDNDCQRVIVVTNEVDFDKVTKSDKVSLVQGGKSRQESVRNGLKLVDSEFVMIHDGARPYLDMASLEALKAALKDEFAAILAVKAKDTIKEVKNGYIKKTIDRENVYLAQTPQAFKTFILKAAYQTAEKLDISFTDDASLIEYIKMPVKVVESNYANKKITFKEDLI